MPNLVGEDFNHAEHERLITEFSRLGLGKPCSRLSATKCVDAAETVRREHTSCQVRGQSEGREFIGEPVFDCTKAKSRFVLELNGETLNAMPRESDGSDHGRDPQRSVFIFQDDLQIKMSSTWTDA